MSSPESVRDRARGDGVSTRSTVARSGRERRTLTDHVRPVYWLRFSADGKRLASASAAADVEQPSGVYRRVAGAVCFWDAATGRLERRVDNPGPGTRLCPQFTTVARPWTIR